MNAEDIQRVVVEWARGQPAIQVVALVGSYARGDALKNSDLDFVLLAVQPADFRADILWLDAIDWKAINVRPAKWEDEDYGALWSRRIGLENGGEIEIGFAPISWACLDPIDPGTRRVISNGCRILYDPKDIFSRLCAAVRRLGEA